MKKIAVSVENISKKYSLGLLGSSSFRETISNKASSLFRKEKKAKEENVFWALKDISFNVKAGEVMGVIGKNGAGKSTLLKVISQITEPTSGRIKINGRVASLLEVGTGFHPELTGRENVFLNGAILGMSRGEIRSKFDEIVDFSGVEKFIDTPVKRYSSGMYVRLAFSVAAHLEPEILLVDEVLSVGDAEFQRKCLGKMGEVAKGGRTILFVSHNMDAVKKLCTKAVLVNNGKVAMIGEPEEVVNGYTRSNEEDIKGLKFSYERTGLSETDASLISSSIINSRGEETGTILYGEPISIKMLWDIKEIVPALSFAIKGYNMHDLHLFTVNTLHEEKFKKIKEDEHEVFCTLPTNVLSPGQYYLNVGAFIIPHTRIQMNYHCLKFEVIKKPFDKSNQFLFNGNPIIGLKSQWRIASKKY